MLVGLLSAAIKVPSKPLHYNCSFKANARETPEYESKDLQRRISILAKAMRVGVGVVGVASWALGVLAALRSRRQCHTADAAAARGRADVHTHKQPAARPSMRGVEAMLEIGLMSPSDDPSITTAAKEHRGHDGFHEDCHEDGLGSPPSWSRTTDTTSDSM